MSVKHIYAIGLVIEGFFGLRAAMYYARNGRG